MRLPHLLAILPALLAPLAWAGPGVVAPPNQIAQAKILEWGWDTPSPTYVRQHIREMEQVPFDGIVLSLTANGMHDLSQRPDRQHAFPGRVFAASEIPRAEFTESIQALKETKFQKFTDNFLRCNVQPGDRDWFEPFPAAKNAGLLAAVAKESGLKGIMLDTEAYSDQIFNYKKQPQAAAHTLEEYQKQVRSRGRQFMHAINDAYPDITIIITLAYSMAHFPDENAQKYQLLPAFLDGMLQEAKPGTVIYDGWEWAYSFRTEKEFADTRRIIRQTALTWTNVPEAMKQHWRASFGVWLDYGSHWNPTDFSKNFFTPNEFAFTVHQGLRYTDRYVWIWSERANWWHGTVPQPYIDALKQARQPEVPPPATRPH